MRHAACWWCATPPSARAEKKTPPRIENAPRGRRGALKPSRLLHAMEEDSINLHHSPTRHPASFADLTPGLRTPAVSNKRPPDVCGLSSHAAPSSVCVRAAKKMAAP